MKTITKKELSEFVRIMSLTETAPPPWVPFGTRQTSQGSLIILII